ncbi:MAG: hypothetical protein COU81_02765 [Candidatus Portnoybacteria bacterium CG10_big_fil_rev_8_21_14_0_10_36_7]|uniref:FAD/NAD(P)-binding domain-containing protein n=1 Tax=Candidatus Portnoybacteria bacterium CG10_big_fil_rev_8_21_14_0_10_36_7 TaxID=1974812 RepID=A0A2M8KDQ6_9BACT|nr:MAG: hypothetical protein COU81_02765 [Candidatus Portnoybacteria bacterium CG10_big_fil_rev_8_21_14_0_10_36_7]
MDKQKIVILGGGFGGVRCAKDLARLFGKQVSITLIDKNDYQLFYPALYEASTTLKSDGEALKVKKVITFPYDKIFAGSSVEILKAKIISVDTSLKQIFTDSKVLNYDYLVVSTGAETEYFNTPGAKENSMPLKTLENAIALRNKIAWLVESASASGCEELRFVIVGGGFVAVEFVGELKNYLDKLAHLHKLLKNKIVIEVIEGNDSLLAGLSPKVAEKVQARLCRLGIKFKFGKRITEVLSSGVVLDGGEKIKANLVIWAAGVKGCSVNYAVVPLVNKRGRVEVDEYLRMKDNENVFVLGDVCSFGASFTGHALPQLAQIAIDEGKQVAKNIQALMTNERMIAYKPSTYGFMVPVSGKYAIFCSAKGEIIVSGFIGWVLRRLADLRYIVNVLSFGSALKIWMSENILFIKND